MALIDYVSFRLTKIMIERGKKALFLRDKQGNLPIHIAVSSSILGVRG